MKEEVVITGVGVMSPIGCDEATFWDSLTHGRSGAGPVAGFDTSELPRSVACQVRGAVDAPRNVGRASVLAVAAARQAVQSAGLTSGDLERARTTTIAGTTMGETEFIEERIDADDPDWLSSEHMQRIMLGQPGGIAKHVRHEVGATGPALDLYGACAAGNMAIATARDRLLRHQCDFALAGGADGFSRLAFLGFMRLRVMAESTCRPFDQERDGLLVGEGGAMFVLERTSTARARGVRVRARVIGAGLACESYHPTRPHPDGDGLTRATNAALRDAGLAPEDIDYVCAHGTGTPQNDAIEVNVLRRCFPNGVSFSSVKALTGHPMGAAAAVEALACILSMEHRTLIPTWHLENVLQPCELDAVRGAPREAELRFVVNNSAGFGGYNSSIVLAA